MSEEVIKTLNARINELTRELVEVKGEAADRRQKGKALRNELAEAKKAESEARAAFEKQIADLTAERDGLRAKVDAAPSEIQAENDKLRGELRTIKHRSIFDAEAKKAGINPDALEAFWKLSGYEAKDDTPDASQVGQFVGEAAKAHPYLLAQQAGATPAVGTRVPAQPLSVPLDGGRGAPVAAGNVVRVRKSDMQNPRFTLDPKNMKAVSEAAKNGTLEVVDDVGTVLSGPVRVPS